MFKMFKKTHTAGYSLVEVLISISILMISIVGPLTIASKGLQNARLAREQNTAFFLAQEGLEAIVQLRNTNGLEYFNSVTNDSWEWNDALVAAGCTGIVPCGVEINSTNNTLFQCSGVNCNLRLVNSGAIRYQQNIFTGVETGYRREIFVTQNIGNVHVQSVVTWTGTQGTETVELDGYFYDIHGG